MPTPRPQVALRASQSLLANTKSASVGNNVQVRRFLVTSSTSSKCGTPPCASAIPIAKRSLSTSPSSASASHDAQGHEDHGHESHFEPPTGWLWGIPPGEKPEREGWETIWYWGFYGSLIAGAVAYAFKPDTSIETWALEEAKRRLQAEGTLPEDE